MRTLLTLSLVTGLAALACGGSDQQRGEACDRDWPHDGPAGNCDENLICASGTCRTQCKADAHCPSGCTCSRGALGIDTLGHCTGASSC